MDTARIGVRQVNASDPVAGILQTQPSPAQPRHAARAARARMLGARRAACDVDFLLQGHLPDEAAGGGVCGRPDAGALPLRCGS